MGLFSVHPYLTDDGIVVDVYSKGAESESATSCWAMATDAEEIFCKHHGIETDDVQAWALTQGFADLWALSPQQFMDLCNKFLAARPKVPPAELERLRKKSVLEEIGYSFYSSSEVGPWAWHADASDCEDTFEDEVSVVADAWCDAVSRVLAIHTLSQEQWLQKSWEEQSSLVRALANPD